MKLFQAAVLATAVSANARNRRNPHTRVDTCEAATSSYMKSTRVFWGTYNRKNYDTCILSKLLNNGNMGRDQIRKAIYYIDNTHYNESKQLYAEELFSKIVDNWLILTGYKNVPTIDEKIDCGFKQLVEVHPPPKSNESEGYINQCGKMCSGLENVNDIESAQNAVKEFMNGFLSIVDSQFSVRYPDGNGCWYDDITEDHPLLGYKRDGWVNGQRVPCRIQDKCNQLIRNIYRNVQAYENLLGEDLSNLGPKSERYWMTDETRLTAKNDKNEYEDDFLAGVFGLPVSGELLDAKEKWRENKWGENKWRD